MKRWSLVAAAVAVAGIAGYGLSGSKADSLRPPNQARGTAVALATPPPEARPQPRAAPTRVRPPTSAQDPPEPGEMAAADSENPDPTDQKIAETLDGAIRAEALDPAWAKAMDARVGDYFHSERATGSSLVRSECRSTLCKLEVQHTGSESAEQFVHDVSRFIPEGSNAVILPQPGGDTPQTLVWFTRHGAPPLP